MSDEKDDADKGNGELTAKTAETIRQTVFESVGYKNPPKANRFKSGQSGNPKGRPKQGASRIGDHLEIHDQILRIVSKLIQVREGEKTRSTSLLEAVLKRQIKTALDGSAYAQKHVIERVEKAQAAKARRIADDVAFWDDYVKRTKIAIERAKADEAPEPKFLPHPDDIEIDTRDGVRFTGPVNDAAERQVLEWCRIRDQLLLQEALDQRLRAPTSTSPDDQPGSALLFALLLDDQLPSRLQIDEVGFLLALGRAERLTQRELLKAVRDGWAQIGMRARRGHTFPSIGTAKRGLSIAFAGIAAIQRGDIDIKSLTVEQLANALNEIAANLGYDYAA